MKDEDYGPDDMIGTQELELDDLAMDTKITKILHVNKVYIDISVPSAVHTVVRYTLIITSPLFKSDKALIS